MLKKLAGVNATKEGFALMLPTARGVARAGARSKSSMGGARLSYRRRVVVELGTGTLHLAPVSALCSARLMSFRQQARCSGLVAGAHVAG